MSLSKVEVETNPPYPVRVGPGAAGEWATACAGADRIALVADSSVHALHAGALGGIDEVPCRLLTPGEDCKTWGEVGETLEFLVASKLSRRSVVLALGGGAACDHAGLAASLYKRGCAVVHIPTSLLAQVDASVGGKTAVNLASGKNLAGTFHQPREVLADTSLLSTLPEEELRSGLGEVLKTALLGGEVSLSTLEESADALMAGDQTALARVVHDCIATKARVVAADPHEAGLRRALNLGHTFGHGIEHCAGYGVIPHGVAVAAGIGLALRAGAARGSTPTSLVNRVASLATRLGLPKSLDELRASSDLALERNELIAAFAHDKKGSFGSPEFVLLEDVGRPELGVELEADLLAELL